MCIVFAVFLQERATVVIQFSTYSQNHRSRCKKYAVESAIPLDYYVLQVDTAAAAVLPTNLPDRKFTPTAADGKVAAAVVVAVVSVC